MAELAEAGWRRFSLVGVARRTGGSVADVQAVIPTRWHLLRRLNAHLDRATFKVTVEELAALSVRDRLFELVMRRLDATTPFKPGVRRLARDAAREPALIVLSGSTIRRSAGLMLDVAESGLGRPGTRLAAHALAALYLRVLNVWLDDESDDQARTLAELDRRLGQADRAARFAQRWRPRCRSTNSPARDEKHWAGHHMPGKEEINPG
ncbi:transcriptional regulator, TetR family [Arboricoccus pini]|uniref:Transcriptional regulator, TetR family n=2 Tax=Arboricoccus pini TaxID=1963835 RepID=A0A212S1Q5_9PROT|nr:transcriptional regulator, TetR family [Arboricoccus pini]